MLMPSNANNEQLLRVIMKLATNFEKAGGEGE